MIQHQDLLFYIPAGLAVLFMIWVLFKFTQQLAGPAHAARSATAESRYLHVIRAGARTRSSANAQD